MLLFKRRTLLQWEAGAVGNEVHVAGQNWKKNKKIARMWLSRRYFLSAPLHPHPTPNADWNNLFRLIWLRSCIWVSAHLNLLISVVCMFSTVNIFPDAESLSELTQSDSSNFIHPKLYSIFFFKWNKNLYLFVAAFSNFKCRNTDFFLGGGFEVWSLLASISDRKSVRPGG